MNIQQYVDKINTRYKSGITTEHSFRGDLQNLVEAILPGVLVTNEPTHIECGAPDYILTRHNIPVGYIEAKDLGADLNSKSYTGQFNRYRQALQNLIITNYLDFHVYKDGALVSSYKIGEIADGKVVSSPPQFNAFTALLRDFATLTGQTIKSSQKLAVMMADKAKMLALVIEAALRSDEASQENSSLKDQMKAFQDILIHDITTRSFADLYAQTIAYGMFAARLHDPTLATFTRQEAAELIPKSNPFLRKLFQYIAGYDLDTRIVWIVDALADIFRATDVKALLTNFGSSTLQNDPIIHFYETFLAEYDPALRKARGVWYTPEPVVKFIIRAVDDILKSEFGLEEGLADTSKTKIKTKVFTKATADQRSKIKETELEQEVHKVQILDPATGTGTFLAEVVKFIYSNKFRCQEGIWSNYVEKHLLSRLNGFELIMASYAMAHLKLDLLLSETGFKATKEQRFKIYLTNTLEEHHPDTGTLFANWLSTEANEANQIKRDTPVMVVLGNPPYAVSSSNKNPWISSLITDYKKGLDERKINLDDDYIKFIRYGQHLIDKTGGGILAYISNNSFIDGLTHRQMRKKLLTTFDKIYILDLHGSSKKNERAIDGGKDENIFDIMQGVSINLFIKTAKKTNELGEVYHSDIRGKRDVKYQALNSGSLQNIQWNKLTTKEPYFFFVPKNFVAVEKYNCGFKLTDLFQRFVVGIETQRDAIAIQFHDSEIKEVIANFKTLSVENIRLKYQIDKDGRDWKIGTAKNDVIKNPGNFCDIFYRPFDIRKTYYTGKSKGFMAYPRNDVMEHMNDKLNLSLIVCKQQSTYDFQHIFITNLISDGNSISIQTKERANVFPLYIYGKHENTIGASPDRTPNFKSEVINTIETSTGLRFLSATNRQHSEEKLTPEHLIDYIYAVLNCPTFRKQYKEFLKIDFPRIPYPTNRTTFWKVVELGKQLRELHLFESVILNKYITQYPTDGSNRVTKIKYHNGNVYINDTQYFAHVPSVAWEFFIGGYQPAQKWLKDRKDRELTFDDILHYQKMIVALTDTNRIMEELDKVIEL
jgi:predicted helicase